MTTIRVVTRDGEERRIPATDGSSLMLAIRGANSDLLAEKTLVEMGERHPDCETFVAPGQGHAPMLGSKDMVRRIGRLVARVERRAA